MLMVVVQNLGLFNFFKVSNFEPLRCLNGMEFENIGPMFFFGILKYYFGSQQGVSFKCMNVLVRARQIERHMFLSSSNQRIHTFEWGVLRRPEMFF